MNEMALDNGGMYEAVAEVNQLNRVEGFDPRKYMRLITNEGQTGRYYLDVAFRKLWFRLKYPNGKIVKKLIKLSDEVAVVEAKVYFSHLHNHSPLQCKCFWWQLRYQGIP